MEVITAAELREQLKDKLELVYSDKKTLVIKNSGKEDVVMMPRSEFDSWKETFYLLSTQANRDNLELSIKQAEEGKLTSLKSEDLWK